jgi:hypothetical protein
MTHEASAGTMAAAHTSTHQRQARQGAVAASSVADSLLRSRNDSHHHERRMIPLCSNPPSAAMSAHA